MTIAMANERVRELTIPRRVGEMVTFVRCWLASATDVIMGQQLLTEEPQKTNLVFFSNEGNLPLSQTSIAPILFAKKNKNHSIKISTSSTTSLFVFTFSFVSVFVLFSNISAYEELLSFRIWVFV